MSVGSKILFSFIIVLVSGLLWVVVRLSSGNSQLPFLFYIPLVVILFAAWHSKPPSNDKFVKDLDLYKKMLLLVMRHYDQTKNIKNPELLAEPIMRSLKTGDEVIDEGMRKSLENILKMPKMDIEIYLKAAADTMA